MKHLELSEQDANVLHTKYYTEYGLAIEGLARFHKVDPLAFNHEVDDALPLERLLKPDPKLRKLLLDIDTTKVKLWLFTNAYVTHGKRVIKILGIDDLFEGITYCDYAEFPLICKPHKAMFDKAEAEAGVSSRTACYFVGMKCPWDSLHPVMELMSLKTILILMLPVLTHGVGMPCKYWSRMIPSPCQEHRSTKSVPSRKYAFFSQSFSRRREFTMTFVMQNKVLRRRRTVACTPVST